MLCVNTVLRRICELLPWQTWRPCDSTCGGKRSRQRYLCCRQYEDIYPCLRHCRRTLSDLTETSTCKLTCVSGVFLNGTCECDDHSYGKCCQNRKGGCSSKPCYNNAACVDLRQDYKCYCKKGWTGFNCNERKYASATTTTSSNVFAIAGSGDSNG
ncbi:hypothetical protein LSAT2_020529 [Lamellibrachia satsuma]|nr:hypothetical protein LSAT2_020529 [Lamellibrachia satsuma]